MKHEKVLHILIGIPGAGKSTFVNKYLTSHEGICISRDIIRKSILRPDQSYFGAEKAVYNELIHRVQHELDAGHSVFVDQTSLNEGSRLKLVNSLNLANTKVILVWVNTPLEIALARNSTRTGFSYVPESQLKKMYKRLEIPDTSDYADELWEVDEKGEIINVKNLVYIRPTSE